MLCFIVSFVKCKLKSLNSNNSDFSIDFFIIILDNIHYNVKCHYLQVLILPGITHLKQYFQWGHEYLSKLKSLKEANQKTKIFHCYVSAIKHHSLLCKQPRWLWSTWHFNCLNFTLNQFSVFYSFDLYIYFFKKYFFDQKWK